jgi:hypothetical protein
MFKKFLPRIENSKVNTQIINWNRRPLDINQQYLAVRSSAYLISLKKAIFKTLELTTKTNINNKGNKTKVELIYIYNIKKKTRRL